MKVQKVKHAHLASRCLYYFIQFVQCYGCLKAHNQHQVACASDSCNTNFGGKISADCLFQRLCSFVGQICDDWVVFGCGLYKFAIREMCCIKPSPSYITTYFFASVFSFIVFNMSLTYKLCIVFLLRFSDKIACRLHPKQHHKYVGFSHFINTTLQFVESFHNLYFV